MKNAYLPAASLTLLALTFAGCPSPGGTSGSNKTAVVDTTAPVVGVDPLTTNQRRPQLTGTIDDPTATVTLAAGALNLGAATNDGNGHWTVTPAFDIPDSTYTLLAKAVDPAGNVGQATAQLVVDTTPPTVTVNPLTTNDTTPPLTGTVNDPAATVSVTLVGKTYPAANNGNGTWTLADNTISPPLLPGTYDVTLQAADALGNAAQTVAAAALVIDTTPPVVTADALTTNQRRPQLTGTIDDATATVTAAIGTLALGTAVNSGNGTWALTSPVDIPDGTQTVTVTARDPAGNAAQATALLVLDATPPHVTVDPLATASTSPGLSGTIDDPTATIQVAVAGQTYTPFVSGGVWTIPDNTISPPLAPGWYDVAVTATDTFGNVGTDGTTNELRVTEAPTVYRAVVADDNLSMLITFDQPVYADVGHSLPIDLTSLQMVYERGPDPVVSVNMSSITNAAGGSLLGATEVLVGFSLVGGPTLGLSFVSISAAPGAIWNAQGQVATKLNTGYLRLHDPRNLLNDYEWSFDKFLDNSPNRSWHVVNVVGTTSLYSTGQRSALLANPTSLYADRSITMPNDLDPTAYIPVTPATAYKISAWIYVKSNSVGTAADTGIWLQLEMGHTAGSPSFSGTVLTVPATDSSATPRSHRDHPCRFQRPRLDGRSSRRHQPQRQRRLRRRPPHDPGRAVNRPRC